jgi:ABC-type transport system substrate-binding protein
MWNKDSPFNFSGYDNPATFATFEQAQRATDEAQANTLWKQAAAQLIADRPYTWLYFLDGVVGVRDRLQGVRVDTYGAYQNTWEWWVKDGRGNTAGGGDSTGADSAGTRTKG